MEEIVDLSSIENVSDLEENHVQHPKIDKIFEFRDLMPVMDKTAIIYHQKKGHIQTYTYEEVVMECLKLDLVITPYLVSILRKEYDWNILALMDHSPEIYVFLLTAWNRRMSVSFVDDDDVESVIETNLYRSAFYICRSYKKGPEQSYLNHLCDCSIFGINYSLYSMKSVTPFNIEIANDYYEIVKILYAVKTSGTTGDPKVVRVPYQSISTNYQSLSQLLQMNSSDVILLRSPPTFDPFYIDVLLALHNKASLLILSKEVRHNNQYIAENCFNSKTDHAATILQTTPSLFMVWSNRQISKSILGSNSSLRCLLLGGEKLPSTNVLNTWQDWKHEKATKVFNIYGLTEMSCWSMMHEISSSDFDVSEIPLGAPIEKDTQIHLLEYDVNEEIANLAFSNHQRICFINDQRFTSNTIIETNDRIYIKDKKFYYRGRNDEQIKRLGHKVNLSWIEQVAMNIQGVFNAACCVSKESGNFLILFVMAAIRKATLLPKLRNELNPEELPNHVVFVDSMPMTNHGKIDKPALLKNHPLKDVQSIGKFMLSEINDLLDMKVTMKDVTDLHNDESNTSPVRKPAKMRQTMLHRSFGEAGGKSIDAIRIINGLEFRCKRPFPGLLAQLLSKKPLLDILHEFNQMSDKSMDENSFDKSTKNVFTVAWRYEMKKCVDSSPTLFEYAGKNGKSTLGVAVGSHSGIFCTLNAYTGELLNSFQADDRVECQATVFENSLGRFVCFGCHNGLLYVRPLIEPPANGRIMHWSVDSESMIKSRPLIINETIVFGTYGKYFNIYFVNTKTKLIYAKSMLGKKSIYAGGCALADGKSFIMCTLDGCVGRCDLQARLIWNKRFSTIFATPILLDEKLILIVEVIGKLRILNLDGDTQTVFQAAGEVFSSPEVIKCPDTDKWYLWFGCHDGYVYKLNYTNAGNELGLEYKINLRCSISAKLCVFTKKNSTDRYIIACNTQGMVYLINDHTAIVEATTMMNGGIFSNPVIFDNAYCIFGCRDNYVYCLKIPDISETDEKGVDDQSTELINE